MLKRGIYYFVLSLLIVSCTKGSEDEIITLISSNKKELLTAEVLYSDKELNIDPSRIFFMTNHLVISEGRTKQCLSTFNLRSKKIEHYFNRGRGPNEMIQPTSLVKNSRTSFEVIDNGMSINYFSFNEHNIKLVKSINIKNDSIYGIINSITLDSSTILTSGLFNGGMYAVLDGDGNLKQFVSDFPDDGVDLTHKMIKGSVYQGTFAAHPNKEIVAYATKNGAMCDIIEGDSGIFSIRKRLLFHLPKYEVIQQGSGMTCKMDKNNNIVGFIDLVVDEKNIYLLYSGRKYGDFANEDMHKAYKANSLLVLDWEGQFIMSYKLDNDVYNIAISDNQDYLYAISDYPRPEIYRFKF